MKFNDLPDEAVVRLPAVRNLFAISSPTVWRWSKTGVLPEPIRIGGITAWRVGDLRKALRLSAEGAGDEK
jgi:predicted DNA-binding transcriptional regulator AlpA